MHPGDRIDFEVDFETNLTRWHESGRTYAAAVRVRVPARPGFEYEATSGGQTGKAPPIFPTVIGQTVSDGSIVWTCRAVTTSSLTTTLVSAVWSVLDSGVTASGQAVSGQAATAFLHGGVDGNDYRVLVTGTMQNGAIMNRLCILPVRVPRRICIA
jgi:hypothetical protein